MSKHKNDSQTEVEVLRARITYTENGFPVQVEVARSIHGPAVMKTTEPGWFWIFATPKAAANIRANGHHAKGTLTETYIPPVGPHVPATYPEGTKRSEMAPKDALAACLDDWTFERWSDEDAVVHMGEVMGHIMRLLREGA